MRVGHVLLVRGVRLVVVVVVVVHCGNCVKICVRYEDEDMACSRLATSCGR